MAVTLKVLIPSKISEDSNTTQYTSSAGQTIIDKFTATNFGATAETISVALITVATAWDNANIIVRSKTLQPDETYTFPEIVGAVLGLGDYIDTEASDANSINIRSSGRIVT